VSDLPTLTDAELRRAPSREALAQVCADVCPGGQVARVRRLRGGITSGMHAVTLIGPNGDRQQVVVRRFGAWRIRNQPGAVKGEAAILMALARAGAAVPRPIWLDESGAIFGCPTLVISLLPGRGDLAPRDMPAWVRQQAEAIAQIHAAPLTEAELSILISQRVGLSELLDRDEPPERLAKRPGGAQIWETMRRWWPQIDTSAPTLLHGDYWSGNTLWHRGRLTGIVDWEQPRRGNPGQDIGCCRLDLAVLIGGEAPAIFLSAYEAASGRTIPDLFFWDLYMATWALPSIEEYLGGYHDLGRTDLTIEVARARLDRFVVDALARAESGL
jgi:aminoglycoside phosphotransferase (APT) family kinase protein